MNKYKVLAFDIDDTLINDTKSRKVAFSNVSSYLDIPYTEELGNSFVTFDNCFWDDFQSGKILIPQGTENFAIYLRSLRFQKFYETLSLDYNTAQFLNELYTNHLGDALEPIPGARETLEILKDRYKIIFPTNGVKKFIQHKLDIVMDSPFDFDIICAENVGKNKPNSLFFQYVFQKCHCDKSEILLIGDSLTNDVLGGMKNGIDTCWFNPNHLPLPQEYEPTMEIDNLLELTRKL